METKRFAIVGTGLRSGMYSRAIIESFPECARLVGLCDTNAIRMQYWNEVFADNMSEPVPMYGVDDFEGMIREQAVDEVIVTSVDRTHHEYIVRAMDSGCDVVTEKPMTIDLDKCREIFDAIERTGRRLRVTFNYRYAPRNTKVKELILDGVIGDVFSVHFEWLLNTGHGADYFRRWHRQKQNSGGLLVHKSTHHFDLVNWWLNARPVRVSAMGGLKFYGRENAEARGQRVYRRGTDDPDAANDSFALNLRKNEKLKGLYLDAEHEDGYLRDQGVFYDGIDIEDDVGVLVQYDTAAVMSYHLNAFSPWEGYRVMFNGSEGRLEFEVIESPYVSGSRDDHNAARNVVGPSDVRVTEPVSLWLQRHWEPRQKVELPNENEGGHGGGDARLLQDLFVGVENDPLGRAATHMAGAYSILTGIAANRSIATGETIDLVSSLPKPLKARLFSES